MFQLAIPVVQINSPCVKPDRLRNASLTASENNGGSSKQRYRGSLKVVPSESVLAGRFAADTMLH